MSSIEAKAIDGSDSSSRSGLGESLDSQLVTRTRRVEQAMPIWSDV
jgi:hypothetical protein